MDAKEAGKIMQGHRKRRGLTQDQAVEQSTVPTAQYLSALENGRYDVRNSDHFKSLVALYGLTAEQVREISPGAVVEVAAPPFRGPVPPRLPPVKTPLEIPPALQEAIDKYGGTHPEMLIEANQRAVSSFNPYGGHGPTLTAEDWLDIFMANRRWLVKP